MMMHDNNQLMTIKAKNAHSKSAYKTIQMMSQSNIDMAHHIVSRQITCRELRTRLRDCVVAHSSVFYPTSLIEESRRAQ